MRLLATRLTAIASAVKRLFSPASLFRNSEQGVWYDPSDFTTLFQDSAGTTPVTAVEQPVGLVLDKSGNGNHATQATSAKRPLLKVDGNGKYYLLFDGVDDNLATATFAAPIAQPTSYYIGRTWVVAASTPRHIFDGDATNRQYLTGTTTNENLKAGVVLGIPAPTAGVANVISLRASGATSYVRKNGVQTSGDAGTLTMGRLYLGSNYLLNNLGNFRLYSFVLVGATHSASQIASAESYVNSKTGAY